MRWDCSARLGLDGKLFSRNLHRQWEALPDDEYCSDGLTIADDTSHVYTDDIEETIYILCAMSEQKVNLAGNFIQFLNWNFKFCAGGTSIRILCRPRNCLFHVCLDYCPGLFLTPGETEHSRVDDNVAFICRLFPIHFSRRGSFDEGRWAFTFYRCMSARGRCCALLLDCRFLLVCPNTWNLNFPAFSYIQFWHVPGYWSWVLTFGSHFDQSQSQVLEGDVGDFYFIQSSVGDSHSSSFLALGVWTWSLRKEFQLLPPKLPSACQMLRINFCSEDPDTQIKVPMYGGMNGEMQMLINNFEFYRPRSWHELVSAQTRFATLVATPFWSIFISPVRFSSWSTWPSFFWRPGHFSCIKEVQKWPQKTCRRIGRRKFLIWINAIKW